MDKKRSSHLPQRHNNQDDDAELTEMEAFVKGQLDPSSEEEFLEKLVNSDEDLDATDGAWAAMLTDMNKVPLPDEQQARGMEAQLSGRLRRSDLSGHALRFGTIAFLKVVVAFVQPFLGTKHSRWSAYNRPSHNSSDAGSHPQEDLDNG